MGKLGTERQFAQNQICPKVHSQKATNFVFKPRSLTSRSRPSYFDSPAFLCVWVCVCVCVCVCLPFPSGYVPPGDLAHPCILSTRQVPGEQWAITKCFGVKSLIWKVFEIVVRKVNINWDFIRFLDLVSKVHIWRYVHLRKRIFYTTETAKALCWAFVP